MGNIIKKKKLKTPKRGKDYTEEMKEKVIS